MNRGSSRSLAVVILTVLAVALVGVGVFVALQLQNTEAPDDASAFGFGDDAITDFFDDVSDFFNRTDCELLLNDGLIIALSKSAGTDLEDEFFLTTLNDQTADDGLTKECNFTEEEIDLEATSYPIFESFITYEIKTYNQDSYIYESAQEKTDYVNSFLIDTITSQGQFPDKFTQYYFGTDVLDPTGSCVINIFHDYNEFEYITIGMTGYDCSDPNTQYIVMLMAEATSSYIHESITLIYEEYHFDPANITIVN